MMPEDVSLLPSCDSKDFAPGLPNGVGDVEGTGRPDEALVPLLESVEVKPVIQEQELCPACRGLDLSVSRFNIQKGRSGQRRCAKDGSARESQSPLFSPRYANLRFLLGTYRDIETRAPGCPFCRLVSKSIDKSTLSTVDVENAKCFLTWEVDGRSIDENNLTIQARTRRIHINWDSSAIPDAFAVFLTPRESSDLVTTDANAVWTYSDHFRARRINQDASKIALIRSWLEQCLHEHKGRCGDSFERDEVNFKRVAKAAHFGVLDIVEMRLTSLPQRSNGKSPVSRKKSTAASASDSSSDEESDFDSEGSLFEPYVALSYVWGSKEDQQGFEKLLTNLNNVLTRGFRHAIEEDLKGMPKVIQSSVDLVRRLGYRYLWIDSICIVQDSNRSWKWNSQVMDRIYSNAEFTICAADGINAKAGLVAFDSPEASSEQVIERCGPGLRLMISRDVESQIASSAWNSRAWTFQERLLSRRCLIFTQGRVFFQCRKATFSEDIVASPQASKTSAWSLDLVRSPLALLNKLEERPVWFYMHCVELFSGRCLTKSTDVLAAFNGVSNLIESAMSGPLCFGLPTSHFDLALLWTPQEALKRRVGGDFPSWSWCGWEGGSALYFNHDFIQDCLENVHQWLISHTWIQWHIRDSQSKLRPLWLTCERVLRNQEVRWKGYDSHEPYNPDNSPHPSRMRREYPEAFPRPNDDVRKRRSRRRKVIEIVRERPDPMLDPYGRRTLEGRRGKKPEFHKRAPESPFAVYGADGISSLYMQEPDSPMLQFWTDSVWLYLVEPNDDTATHPDGPRSRACGLGLCRYGIADAAGDWCGSIILSEEWVLQKMHDNDNKNNGGDLVFQFLALSRAKRFTKDECGTWSFYVPFDQQQSEWDLNYVMLVEVKSSVHYRVGVGKVFRHAFRNGVKGKARWEEIVLG
ncbi:heterokaryon incompatibility protein-domain-containing protein [Phyllosticta citricarpa]